VLTLISVIYILVLLLLADRSYIRAYGKIM